MGNAQRLGVALERILLRMRYIVRLLFHISSIGSPHEIFNSMNTCGDASFILGFLELCMLVGMGLKLLLHATESWEIGGRSS